MLEVGQVELAVIGQRNPADLDASGGGQHLPRDDVGVMLHVGQHDRIASPQVGSTPRGRNEIECFGGVLGEHDFVGFRGIDESSDGGPGTLEQVGRFCGQSIGAAIDRSVRGALERIHRLDHLAGLLRGVARIQVDEWAAVDHALQDREIVPDGCPIDGHGVLSSQSQTVARKAS